MQGNILCQSGGNYGQPTITITDLGTMTSDYTFSSTTSIPNMFQLTNEYSYGFISNRFFQYNINTNTLTSVALSSSISSSNVFVTFPTEGNDELYVLDSNNYFLYNKTNNSISSSIGKHGGSSFSSATGNNRLQIRDDGNILVLGTSLYFLFNTKNNMVTSVNSGSYIANLSSTYKNGCCTKYCIYGCHTSGSTTVGYEGVCIAVYEDSSENIASYCPSCTADYLYTTNKYALLVSNAKSNYVSSEYQGLRYLLTVFDTENMRWYPPVMSYSDIFYYNTYQITKTDNSFILWYPSKASAIKVTIDI